MIHKTKGIVFRYTKYSESSIIVTMFTDQFGIQSYIVNGVRSKNSRNKIALYQPLTLLNLVVYHRENANIERIKEIQCFHPYATLLSDTKKSAMAMFITELLNKTVKEESHSENIFEFISDSLIALDLQATGFENFHLLFMLKLSRYLGFGVQHVNEVIGGKTTDEETERLLARLLNVPYTEEVKMTNEHRRILLELLIKFYSEHLENMPELKSVQVLRDVMA
jgi:DNA repair protein RecO (recombination protein O)